MPTDDFEAFFREREPKLREALSATLGSERGREAASVALAYAWEHWDKVARMDNPVGYLYVVGRDRGRKSNRSRYVTLLPVEQARIPWVEPALINSLERLPQRQRTVVVLLHCFDWTMSEVADLLGLSKATIQSHNERGLWRLRRELGVDS